MDRGVDRRPVKSQCYLCNRGSRRMASLQARRVVRLSVLLIICRSRVRAPPAPPAVIRDIRCCLGSSWTEIVAALTDMTMPLWSQRATAGWLLACQTLRLEDPLTDIAPARDGPVFEPARRSRCGA